jgi:catechol 2,3-dioxygenase-like lactoylglutathione lyase family enzyme
MNNLTYLGFGHVGMFIKDRVEAKKFYIDILGFAIVSEYVSDENT